MKLSKKVAAMAGCAVLLISGTIAGTMAYFTDTEAVTNTFTVGKVAITLDEKDTDNDENKNDNVTINGEVRDKANSYKLLPGHTYIKDPTVHVKEDSEPSYVRMLVTVNNVNALKNAFPDKVVGDVFLLQDFVDWNSNVWAFKGYTPKGDGGIGGIYEFRYSDADGIVTVDETQVIGGYYTLPALFETITIPGTIDNTHLAELQGITINVEAHAIQAAGFENADAAWTAFGEQHKAK